MTDETVSGPCPRFLSYFDGMDDPRQTTKITYPLNAIFLLVLCAVISGAQDWVSIALYGRKKLDLLRRFLPFKDGTPSHDQLGRNLQAASVGRTARDTEGHTGNSESIVDIEE